MKKTLLLLLIGAGLGAAGWHFYTRTFPPAAKESAAATKEQALATARTVGGQLEDAGIIALIKGKYVLDRELSALAIGVECSHGEVTLTGSAESPELIARAAEVARQTKGVTGVTSRLTVKN